MLDRRGEAGNCQLSVVFDKYVWVKVAVKVCDVCMKVRKVEPTGTSNIAPNRIPSTENLDTLL